MDSTGFGLLKGVFYKLMTVNVPGYDGRSFPEIFLGEIAPNLKSAYGPHRFPQRKYAETLFTVFVPENP